MDRHNKLCMCFILITTIGKCCWFSEEISATSSPMQSHQTKSGNLLNDYHLIIQVLTFNFLLISSLLTVSDLARTTQRSRGARS